MDSAPHSNSLDVPTAGEAAPQRKPFNLLSWYAWVSLAIILSIGVGLGLISSRFIIDESVERDALLTAQFITAIADAEVRALSAARPMRIGSENPCQRSPQKHQQLSSS